VDYGSNNLLVIDDAKITFSALAVVDIDHQGIHFKDN
jgi:hypothetical protein